MTAPQPPRVEVTQADRDAACALRIYTTSLSEDDYRAKEARETFLTGKRDHWEIVQAFARHRTAAGAASRQEVAKLEAAVMACTAMMDRAALALDGGMPDLDDAICCGGHDCMCRGSSNRELLTYDLRETARNARAALNASDGEAGDANS